MAFEKDVLTTGEVAKICNVAPRTVSKWFDTGQLKGYRIPGSKDRRIPMAQLIRFMKEHGIPFDGIAGGKTRILIVDDEPEIVDTLARVLGEQTNYEVRSATTAFQAGVECDRFKPHVMLLDMHLGSEDTVGNDVRGLAQMVRQDEDLQMTRIVGMSGKLTDAQFSTVRSVGFESFIRKPFAVRQVIEVIEACTAMVA